MADLAQPQPVEKQTFPENASEVAQPTAKKDSTAGRLQQQLPAVKSPLDNWNTISPDERKATLETIRTALGLPETVAKMDLEQGVGASANYKLLILYHTNSKVAGQFKIENGTVTSLDNVHSPEALEGARYRVLHYAEQHGKDLANLSRLSEGTLSNLKTELKQAFRLSEAASELKLVDNSFWHQTLNREGRGHLLFGTKDKYLGSISIEKTTNTPAGNDGWRISYSVANPPGNTSAVYNTFRNEIDFKNAVQDGRAR
jgi:hypothetical protein